MQNIQHQESLHLRERINVRGEQMEKCKNILNIKQFVIALLDFEFNNFVILINFSPIESKIDRKMMI